MIGSVILFVLFIIIYIVISDIIVVLGEQKTIREVFERTAVTA